MEHSMSLVLFTFLSQMAIGAFAALFFLDVYKGKLSKRSSFFSLITILIVSVVAVIVSLFHLGHPFAAYKALLNFGDSWLTREIVFFPAFILFVLLYTFAKTKKQQQLFGWGSNILGVVTIYSTAMIYTIPSVPAWNNGTTIAAFFITALLVGPVFIQVLVSILEKSFVNFNLYTATVAFIAIISNVINLSILNGGLQAAVESAGLIIASPLYWVKIIALVVAFFIAAFVLFKKRSLSFSILGFICACFVVSEFLGRMLFYSSGVHL